MTFKSNQLIFIIFELKGRIWSISPMAPKKAKSQFYPYKHKIKCLIRIDTVNETESTPGMNTSNDGYAVEDLQCYRVEKGIFRVILQWVGVSVSTP